MVTKIKEKKAPTIDIKNPQKIVEIIFNMPLFKSEREKQVVLYRFGLKGNNKKTLESIGHNLKITRERVRQIEKNAIKKIVNGKLSNGYIEAVNKEISNFFIKNGLVISNNLIVSKLLNRKNISTEEKNCLYFLLFINNDLKLIKENKLHHSIWSQKEVKEDCIAEIIKKAVLKLEENEDIIEEKKFIEQICGKNDNKLTKNIIESSKLLIKKGNCWGLHSWRTINPKSINDKIFIILREFTKPLHYSEITIHVNKNYSPTKKITEKAVHNELIKDAKFILIGRGIYALKEWGYEKGTVKDVILGILLNEGKPVHKNDIIEKVLEKRIVKKATIVLNLQNFKRVGKAVYTIN